MFICGPSGCGNHIGCLSVDLVVVARVEANTLMHMIRQLLYYDKIYLHSKNLEQPKYARLLKKNLPLLVQNVDMKLLNLVMMKLFLSLNLVMKIKNQLSLMTFFVKKTKSL